MKLIRIIPNLLIYEDYLVKGKNFKDHDYVGDIYNAVKIYSEKQAHEIILTDILATKKNRKINNELIKKIRNEIFIPLCVGGGIKNIDDASQIIELGVEKISINSGIENNLNLISEISNKYGSQSIVVSLDLVSDGKEIILHQNDKETKYNTNDFKHFIRSIENAGAGEILITSISDEGTRNGFDINFFKQFDHTTNIPIIANGGAKNLKDFEELFDKTDISAACGGACFVYFGSRKAVLINYPDQKDIENLALKYENNQIT